MKDSYWKMMTNAKFQLLYLDLYYGKSIKTERWLDIIFAIISTGSLGGLLIGELAQNILIWILAVTQVLTAARPFLPYQERIRRLDKNIYILKQQYNIIEMNWKKISGGEMSEEKSNLLMYELKGEWEKTMHEVTKGDDMPCVEKYTKKAQEECDVYFRSLFR